MEADGSNNGERGSGGERRRKKGSRRFGLSAFNFSTATIRRRGATRPCRSPDPHHPSTFPLTIHGR
jgi:hypothetical protein